MSPHSSPRPAPPPALPPVGITLALALVAHVLLWPYHAPDVDTFLIPWLTHIRETGITEAFAAPFSNYMPLYLYLLAIASPLATILPAMTVIKLLSVGCTAILSASVWRLLKAFDVQQAVRGAALVFLLPTTLANAPLLAQCDALWAAPCLLAMAMAVERRHGAMLAWFGLAVAIKLQAAFFAPFILAILINRRVPIRVWLVAPLAGLSTLLPAWVAGWPMLDLLTIYVRQAGHFDALSLSAPNIWAIVQVLPTGLPLGGLAMAAAIGASGAYVAWFSSRAISDRVLPAVALLAPLLVVGLLPRMHERYFFLADLLSFAAALILRDRRGWVIAALVQAGSMLALLGYLSGTDPLTVLGAVAMIAATIRVARPLLEPIANDNAAIRRPLPGLSLTEG